MTAMVAAIHQRGGIAMTGVGGYHDAIGIYQAAEAGIDVCIWLVFSIENSAP